MLLSAWKVVPPPMSGGEEDDDVAPTPQWLQSEGEVTAGESAVAASESAEARVPAVAGGEAKAVRMPPVDDEDDGEEQLDEGEEQPDDGEEQLDEGEEQLGEGEEQLDEGDGRQAATVVSCVPVRGEKRRPAAGSTDKQ
jgi:hypothetical protein